MSDERRRAKNKNSRRSRPIIGLLINRTRSADRDEPFKRNDAIYTGAISAHTRLLLPLPRVQRIIGFHSGYTNGICPSIVSFLSPSPSNRRVCVYQPDTTIEIRNVSIFFLLSLWTSSPFFFERGEKIVFVDDQPPFVEVDWSRMSDEKPVNREIFQRSRPAALLIVWNIYERQIRNVELEGLLSGFHHR